MIMKLVLCPFSSVIKLAKQSPEWFHPKKLLKEIYFVLLQNPHCIP